MRGMGHECQNREKPEPGPETDAARENVDRGCTGFRSETRLRNDLVIHFHIRGQDGCAWAKKAGVSELPGEAPVKRIREPLESGDLSFS